MTDFLRQSGSFAMMDEGSSVRRKCLLLAQDSLFREGAYFTNAFKFGMLILGLSQALPVCIIPFNISASVIVQQLFKNGKHF